MSDQQETSISPLTRDGGLRVTFVPSLNADQHAALLEAVKLEGDTIPEMRELLAKLASYWGCRVIIDPC